MDPDAAADAAYDCLQPPQPYAKRFSCCRPLFRRPERYADCSRRLQRDERALAAKIARHNDGNDEERRFAPAPLRSLFDCFYADGVNGTEAARAAMTTSTTEMPTWYADAVAAAASTLPTTNVGGAGAETAAPANHANGLDAYRAGTIEVMMCALAGDDSDDGGDGDAGADAAAWLPIVKRAFDLCRRAFEAAGRVEREQYDRLEVGGASGGCPAGAVHVAICMAERMFVECARGDWAQEGDGE